MSKTKVLQSSRIYLSLFVNIFLAIGHLLVLINSIYTLTKLMKGECKCRGTELKYTSRTGKECCLLFNGECCPNNSRKVKFDEISLLAFKVFTIGTFIAGVIGTYRKSLGYLAYYIFGDLIWFVYHTIALTNDLMNSNL